MVLELLIFVDAHEEIPQVGDKPADADRRGIELHVEPLGRDIENLLDDTGHRVGPRQVTRGKTGIH